jgi:hypothetical protein
MNALATWFLILNIHGPFGGAYSKLGPLTAEECRAGETAIGSPSVSCRQADSFIICPNGNRDNAIELCPVFEN